MSGFAESVGDAVKSAFCSYLGANANSESFFNELSPIDLPETGQFWNRALCDRNAPLPPTPPPFPGGQCPFDYSIQFERRTRNADCSDFGAWNLQGPFGRFRGPIGGVGQTSRPAAGGGFLDEVTIAAATGTVAAAAVFRPDDCSIKPEIRNIQFNPLDGNTDNCGDGPPLPPPFPPSGDTVNIDITYVNNEGDNVTELGDLTIFAPVVVAPVTIVAPIRVDLPDVSFDGQIVLSPDFNVRISPPPIADGPGDVADDDGSPPEDSRRELLGVRCTCSNPEDSKATQVVGPVGAPDLWVPRLGSVAFEILIGDEVTRSQDYDLKQTDQFFPAPDKGLVTRFFVIPVPGVSIRTQAVYREPEALITS